MQWLTHGGLDECSFESFYSSDLVLRMVATGAALSSLHGSWSAAALPLLSRFGAVCRGWWWCSYRSNDLERCAVGFIVSVGVAHAACWRRVPPLVRAR